MNQNPEQKAFDQIDAHLIQTGWQLQDKCGLNLSAIHGIAVKDYLTRSSPTHCLLLLEQKPTGIIDAKREEERVN